MGTGRVSEKPVLHQNATRIMDRKLYVLQEVCLRVFNKHDPHCVSSNTIICKSLALEQSASTYYRIVSIRHRNILLYAAYFNTARRALNSV